MTTNTTELPLPALDTPDHFPFPYPQPYSIQVDLMKTVFQAIENGKIAIVESPTGTGKSLSLLTATLTWLEENAKRLENHSTKALEQKLLADNKDDPPWVIQHAIKSHLQELEHKEDLRRERLLKARERERQLARQIRRSGERPSKKARLNEPEETEGDADDVFLPDDKGRSETVAHNGMNLSAEVMALMEKTDPFKNSEADEEEEECTKIFYTSRTHTQLRQLVAELRKTTFVKRSTKSPSKVEVAIEDHNELPMPIRMVPLAGRKQLCVNEKVREVGRFKGDDRMNELCLELQKSDSKQRCSYLPPKDEEYRMLDMRDQIHAEPKDIEEIAALGKAANVCPYYAARKATKQAELVTLPYNLLLQKTARESLGLNIKDQIIVIDEAHNLIDALLSIYSVNLQLRQLRTAMDQLKFYHQRFRNRLKAVHAVKVAQTVSVLAGLIKACEEISSEVTARKPVDKVINTNQLLDRLSEGQDQINIVELVAYLKGSKLAQKVSGYAEKQAQNKMKSGTMASSGAELSGKSAISAFHQVEDFLLSLSDASHQGRIIISTIPASAPNNPPSVTLRYMLLNPAERFQELVDDARCIVLAGGTMEPLSDFFLQLFPSVPHDRLTTLSCEHIIPSSNLLTQVVSQGPGGKAMDFKFDSRNDQALLLDLGAMVSSVLNIIPDGVVLFVPSYSFLANLRECWTSAGVMAKLEVKKKIFFEPQAAGQVDEVLAGYSDAISGIGREAGSKQTGALMFAVVGAKLSEGINFSDRLGRCIIMVGLPFANSNSVELKERMTFVSSLPGASSNAGRELYENLCMRAVNQSIGRAIRHQNDYATILLVDQRYGTPRISKKLPQWIGKDLKVGGFSDAVRNVAGFFREKKKANSSGVNK